MDFDESSYSSGSSSSSSGEEEDYSESYTTPSVDVRHHEVEQTPQPVTNQIHKVQRTEPGNMDDLVEKLASMEHKLKEATHQVQSSKEQAGQAEKEKNLFKNKAYDLAARLSALKKRLQEKEDEASKLEARNKELDSKVTQLKQEVKSTETHLNKSYNDTLEGLTTHIQEAEQQINDLDNENNELRFKMTEAQRVCKYLQDKLTESEKNHGAVASDTQFKLTEAQRVSKFLEGKLNKMVEEKKKVEDRVVELEAFVQRLKQEIGMKELVIVNQNEKMKQKDVQLADASRQILEVEGKLAASVKVCGFLESTLSRAETALARRGPHPEAVKEINDLKRKLAESNDLITTLNDGLAMARVGQQTMSNRVVGLEGEVTALSAELAEKEDSARSYKAKWEVEASKTSDLAETIRKLKQVSEESKQQVRATESEKEALALQLKTRVGDLEGNLKVFSNQVHDLSSRILQVESEKKEWQDKAHNLEGNLKSYTDKVGELQTRVAQTEEEKREWETKAQDMKQALAEAAKAKDLQEQVAKVEGEKKDLANKAEVLEVQMATICDILREHKPEIAEMFDSSDADEANKPANGTARAGGVSGFAQSLFGNKAVLAVTLAAAVVGLAAGDFSSKPRPTQPSGMAFVPHVPVVTTMAAGDTNNDNLEHDLVGAELQDHEVMYMEHAITPDFERDVMESAGVMFELDEQIEQLSGEEETGTNAEDVHDAVVLDRVGKVMQSFHKVNKIWGKLQSIEAPSEDEILSMM